MKKTYHIGRCGALVCLLAALSSCGTLEGGRRWGEDATLTPGWERIYRSASDAIKSPHTWLPAAGALAMRIDGWDAEASRWASKHTPVFGSQGSADRWSDYLVGASAVAYATSALATPSGKEAQEWVHAKLKGTAVGAGALLATHGAKTAIKGAAGRTRPDGSDSESFPSGHSAYAAAFTALAGRNVDVTKTDREAKMAMKLTMEGIAVGTAWARIEAKKHYPSDVLSGLALGHFVGTFVNDAFLGINREDVLILMNPTLDCAFISIGWVF